MNKSIRYLKRMIGFDSTSSISNRMVSKYVERKLEKYGFATERLEYRDDNQVRKVSIVGKKGPGVGGLAYFSHSDVVPAPHWFSRRYGPFQPAIAKERLYGRGACDMKGSIACMLAAMQRYSSDDMKHPLYFVCTADEEVGFGGARQVVEESRYYREMAKDGTKAIIGEPTMLDVVHAHKGGYSFRVVAKGKAAHSSTREGKNANMLMIPFLTELKQLIDETELSPDWQNREFEPPSLCWNIGVNDNNLAMNVTAEQSVCTAYFRPMPGQDVTPILNQIKTAAERNDLYFELTRTDNGFYTKPDSPFVKTSLELAHKVIPKTASYGTDGCMLSEIDQKIVIGPGNIAQAHTDEEWISLEQLSLGTELYAKFIKHFCC